MAGTILRLGWSDPLTDVFGAHPLLGDVIDLNDGVTFTLLDGALELDAPTREVALSGNARTQGERASRAIYRHNRLARAQVMLGPMAGYSDLAANVRALVRWVDAAPSVPVTLQWQPPSATSPVYLDVVGAAHAVPADEREWLRLQIEPIELVFVVRPGLRGDRVTLANLVANPGFEAGSGPGVQVFNDSFANANAYTLGGSTSVSGGVLTLNANATAAFGSPEWGPLNQWTIRFEWFTGVTADFFLHRDASGQNYTQAQLNGSTLAFNQNVAGSFHGLSSTPGATLTTATWYWLVVTQFPAAPGTPPDLQATLYHDAAGSLGSQMVTSGPIVCVDASAGLSGQPLIFTSGGALNLGGAANSHSVSLFGPGGWSFSPTDGTTGPASGAWEQNTTNTYQGGAVTSFGAARIDVAPAGTLGAFWTTYGGGAPAGTSAIPAAPSQTLGLSAWLRSSGIGAGCAQSLLALEYDASGAFLRAGTVASKSGPQVAWTQLSGAYTTGVSCAYLGLRLEASDPTAGASAGGSIWWDNAQCWNQTTTGQTTMPYCELRFPQSPAQLLLTGLLGDLPAPASLAWGTFLTSWALGSTLSYALGRRGRSDGTAGNARLVGASHGYYATGSPPQATAILDAASYGGYYPTVLMNPSWNPRAFSAAPSDTLGVYHLFSRAWTNQAAGNLPNVETRIITQQRSQPWFGATDQSDQLGAYDGPFAFPISASATWTIADSGQTTSPPLPAGALTDLTQNYLTPRPQWADTTAGGSTSRVNWQLLLPIDGSLLMGLLNNPSNAPFAVTNEWLWVYQDGLLLNRAAIGDAAATTYSIESSPLPSPAHGGGGPGTSSTGAINVNSGADPALLLDPTLSVAAVANATGTAAGGSGVNQLAGYVADNAGAVLPLYAEVQYSPLYLYPR